MTQKITIDGDNCYVEPFPDNATNGDIITAMLLTDKDDIDIKDHVVFINNFQMIIDREFWFAPFKGGKIDE